MDIRKNKTTFHKNIKRFALRATASAIFTLNAKAAMATQDCPALIQGTSLAGTLCSFDLSTGPSVTVENGGVVGAISMSGYTVSPTFMTINAGGTIGNSSNSAAIAISSSSLSNGLSNSGTISSTTAAGIVILSGSTIGGGLSNSGLISTATTGINIADSTINGDISNSGVIRTNTLGTGILINNSTINGGITNSGTIRGSGDFLGDSGITIGAGTIINGDITNLGLISASDANALIIRSHSLVNGGIFNTGRFESATQGGIEIAVSTTIQGAISNNGVVRGGTVGLSVHNESTADSISNSGTISGGETGLSVFSHTTINGSISNSGTISGGATGLLISSTTVINGSISNSGVIQGSTNAVSIVNNSTVNSIDILGQNARMIGAVNAIDTDVNITNGALFTSEGAYVVNIFNIAQNAVFNMANSIRVTNGFNNSGTLAITDPLQTIAGDYTQQTGGLFQTNVSSASDYGQLAVTGVADLASSGDIYVQLSQNNSLHAGDVLSDVISGGASFRAPNNGFNVSDNSYIWEFIPTLNNAGNGVNLTAAINPDAYTVCQGTYCQGAATAIIGQVAAGNPTFSSYATLSTADAFRQAASQATPELTNENIQVVQLITRSVLDIAPMWDSLRGKSSGDAMLYQPGKLWVKPYGASMTQNKRSTVQGFDATAYGAVIGKDIQLTDDWLVGGGFAAGGDKMHGKSVLSGQSIHSQAYQGILYGAKQLPNHAYFAGQGLVGYETNNTSRSIPLYASTAKGSFNSWFTNLRAEAGWSTSALSPNFVFTPEVDASYLFINQGSYQESGSLMDLLVASNHNSSLVLGAYGNGAYHLANINNWHDLTLTGYAGIAGDVLNSQPQVLSTFVASGATFSTFGVQFNGVVFRSGAGLALTKPTSPLSIELNYDIQVGNAAYSGIGAATLKYKT